MLLSIPFVETFWVGDLHHHHHPNQCYQLFPSLKDSVFIIRYGAPLAPVVSYDYPATTVASTTQTTVAEATEEVRNLALDVR